MLAEEHSSATPQVSRYSFADAGDSSSAGDPQSHQPHPSQPTNRSHHSSDDEQIYKPFTITSTEVYISPTASPIKKFEKNSSAWQKATPCQQASTTTSSSSASPSESCGKQPEDGVSLHICSSALGRVQQSSVPAGATAGVLARGGESGDPEGMVADADSGMESAASSWDRSVAEVKEHAFARLQDELRRANEELKLRDEEVTRLSRIRSEVEAELEDLTASLFQEAHKMVREANIQQAAAERSLKEKAMQVDVLTAEVAALKTLVLTSTPSRPNLHLMQSDSRSKDETDSRERTRMTSRAPRRTLEPPHRDVVLRYSDGTMKSNESNNKLKKHRRCPSHFNLKYGRENSPPDSPTEEQNLIANLDSVVNNESCEVDPVFHKEFLSWKQNPTLDKSNEFIARIYREDIDQCLDFNDSQLAEDIRKAVDNGDIFIEAVSDKMKSPFAKKCVLLDSQSVCNYRLRLSNSETWYYISQICRNRITAVCNFLNYLRYIQRGLVKSPAHDIYWEIIRLRKEMMLARLGLSISTS